jgi:hypothetical protein
VALTWSFSPTPPQEWVNGQLKNKYGDAFIRGNNGEAHGLGGVAGWCGGGRVHFLKNHWPPGTIRQLHVGHLLPDISDIAYQAECGADNEYPAQPMLLLTEPVLVPPPTTACRLLLMLLLLLLLLLLLQFCTSVR